MKRFCFFAILGLFAASAAVAQSQGGDQAKEKSGENKQPDQRRTQEQASAPGTPLYLSPADVRLLQQALNKQGYAAGEVNGIWSKATAKAAANYQQAEGLEPIGKPTFGLIARLGQKSILGESNGGSNSGGAGQSTSSGSGSGQGSGDDSKQAGAKPIDQEAAASPGVALYLGPTAIRSVQRALNKKGYEAGSVDGRWTPRTADAARNFQAAHKLEPTGKADIDLINALKLNKTLFATDKKESAESANGVTQEAAGGGGTPLWLGPAQVRQIQTALSKQGYAPGAADGRWTQQLAVAVRNFQQARGLEPTGRPTPALLRRLGMKQWQKGAGGNSESGSKKNKGSLLLPD